MHVYITGILSILLLVLLQGSIGSRASNLVIGAHPLDKLRNFLERKTIQCVLCDMDGTLLNEQHKVDQATIPSIDNILKAAISFFPATGRTRKSVMDVTNGSIQKLFGKPMHEIPGVYSQGLQVYGKNGALIYERFIESHLISQVTDFCAREGISVVAYAGDNIYCKTQSAQTAKVTDYGDPLPVEFSKGLHLLEYSARIKSNKLIMLADEAEFVRVRPSLTSLLLGKATITKAVPGMLEILPHNASKGAGVQILLDHFGISPENTAAIGDGENDFEMLEVAGLAIAMKNAKPGLKSRADYITRSNNDNGVGYVLDEIFKHARGTP